MKTDKQESADKIVGATDGLGGEIQVARENLARIIAKFDGSENHKQIRMLRRRVLKKLLKQVTEIQPPNAKLTGGPSGPSG